MLYDIESVKNHTESSSSVFSTIGNFGEVSEKLLCVVMALGFGYYTGQKNNPKLAIGGQNVENKEETKEVEDEIPTPHFKEILSKDLSPPDLEK